MPKNAFNGVRVLTAHVHDQAFHVWTPNEATAEVTAVPAGTPGTFLQLPDEPGSGDWYQWANPDNSCSATNQIKIGLSAAATSAGVQIQTTQGISFSTPGTSGIATFDEGSNTWSILSAQYQAESGVSPLQAFSESLSVPVADGPAAVAFDFGPYAGVGVGDLLQINGYVEVQNTAGSTQVAVVSVEDSPGGGGSILPSAIVTRVNIPAGGFVTTVPFLCQFLATLNNQHVVVTVTNPGGTNGNLVVEPNTGVAILSVVQQG